ncbi:MAG: hypothetical protein ACP59X_22635 [Solidesulfovibrio sp. DCME]|uniref:hypothetical protein n=1 Tax=Solidesulfovibrio sp. DCME TaxID=3447380 RepID=UPI003D0C3E87
MNDILAINANLKYIEFILNLFDNGEDNITLADIRLKFRENFKMIHPLLNQNFGILRLLPIVLIREDIKGSPNKNDDKKNIMIIRHAVCHNGFSMSEKGYKFSCDKGEVEFNYKDFVDFVHRIENLFHNNSL